MPSTRACGTRAARRNAQAAAPARPRPRSAHRSCRCSAEGTSPSVSHSSSPSITSPQPELEDVGRGADQPGGLEHARLLAARVDHHLGLGPRAGLQRPDSEQAEPAVGAGEQRRLRGPAGFRRDRRTGSAWRRATVAAAGRPESPRPAAILDQAMTADTRNRALGGAAPERTRGRAPRPRRHRPRRDRDAPSAIPDELSWPVVEALSRAGIERLYEHQAEALHQAFDGPTVVTTGTASGKSLCFQLPTLEVLTSDRTARALYLYPTKALAQDQARVAAPLRPDQGDPARRSTTATRRATSARRSASAAT